MCVRSFTAVLTTNPTNWSTEADVDGDSLIIKGWLELFPGTDWFLTAPAEQTKYSLPRGLFFRIILKQLNLTKATLLYVYMYTKTLFYLPKE